MLADILPLVSDIISATGFILVFSIAITERSIGSIDSEWKSSINKEVRDEAVKALRKIRRDHVLSLSKSAYKRVLIGGILTITGMTVKILYSLFSLFLVNW